MRQIRSWFEQAARAAPRRLRLRELGRSYGGRPLYLAILTSPENSSRFAEIVAGWRGLVDGTKTPTTSGDLPPIVWLSYGVHGNETSAAEVAPLVAHSLLTNARHARLLDDVIVVIDPCLNPDGRERYIAGFEDRSGPKPDPEPASAEHVEPWPGGRTNHYLQDLNRDWAFQTQRETRLRIAAWLDMPPQVHVDYHEMFPEDEYFFFPAELPVNRHVPKSILAWHEVFGRANARLFDSKRWRYYSAEDFDLFYPGYGDSWPSLMGAVGMTYECGGHGAGGLAYRRRDGRIWTLRDRIDRHFATSIVAIETAAAHRAALRRDFWRSHRDAEVRGRARKRRFLCIDGARRPSSVAALADLLIAQGIRVDRTTEAGAIRLPRGSAAELTPLAAGSLVVDLAQPRGSLAAALLEPDAEISHLYFYDVSAWSLPLAFGVAATWSRSVEAPRAAWSKPTATERSIPGDALAVLVDAAHGQLPRLAARATTRGIECRIGSEAFSLGGHDYGIGTLVLLPEPAQHDALLEVLAGFPHLAARAAATTRTDRGPDLGSGSFEPLVPIRPAMAFGRGTSSASAGAIWHLFDETLGLPITRLPHDRISTATLARYNLLILPGGGLPRGLSGNDDLAFLRRWLADGGVLLAFGSAARVAATRVAGLRDAKPPRPAVPTKQAAPAWKPLAERRAEGRERSEPGAIVAVRVDSDQPLAAGYGARLPVLVRGRSSGLPITAPGQVIAFYGKAARLSGYLPKQAAKRLEGRGYLVEVRVGRGAVVLFDQDPQFRLFWHGLTRMFLNAALLLPRKRLPRR